ncbi:MAG: tRNA1(Val) (adenine(37)-N6)-methyltransferase [Hyphomicrobiaceae bacterium]
MLLSAAVPVRRQGPAERLIDVGAGAGLVGLAAAMRAPGLEVTLLEIEPELAALATRNAALNGLSPRTRVVVADVSAAWSELAATGLATAQFDHAAANPPYETHGRGTPPPDPLRARANVMTAEGLDDWARLLAAVVKPGGTVTVIHRADALPRLLSAFGGRFGGLSVLPLFPAFERPAHRLLLHGIKGSRAPLTLHRGFVLHDADGKPSADIQAVLAGEATIDIVRGRIATHESPAS